MDAAFKSQCLRGGTTEQRGAAEEAAKAVRDEGKWGALTLLVKLLRPLATALDSGQANVRGLGSVRRSFYEVEAHFGNFDYDVAGRRGDGGDRLRFKQHTLRCLQERKRYTLRPIHSLAYLLDPRYTDAAEQPDAAEATEAFALLKELVAAHDVKVALALHGVDDESSLPASYSTTTQEHIMHEDAQFKSKAGGRFELDLVWEVSTVRDPLCWWVTWGKHVPSLQAVAVRIMKVPVGFAAGERSFSNASHIQSPVRTRLSHARLHKLLYIYYNSRALPHVDVTAGLPVTASTAGSSGAGGRTGPCGDVDDGSELEGVAGEPSLGEAGLLFAASPQPRRRRGAAPPVVWPQLARGSRRATGRVGDVTTCGGLHCGRTRRSAAAAAIPRRWRHAVWGRRWPTRRCLMRPRTCRGRRGGGRASRGGGAKPPAELVREPSPREAGRAGAGDGGGSAAGERSG